MALAADHEGRGAVDLLALALARQPRGVLGVVERRRGRLGRRRHNSALRRGHVPEDGREEVRPRVALGGLEQFRPPAQLFLTALNCSEPL